MSTTLEQFKSARRVSTPLVAILTPDPSATMQMVMDYYNGKAPLYRWDIINGLAALNEPGLKDLPTVLSNTDQSVTVNPSEALALSLRMTENSIVFFLNAHRFIGNEAVSQAIWNLREPFKSNRRTLVMLAPEITLPVELQQDVLILDEPLPNDEQIANIVEEQFKDAGLKGPAAKDLTIAVDALRGLAAFPAEQSTAMSLTEKGLDLTGLWDRKRRLIEQVQGLSIDRGGETFDDIGGQEQIKQFGNGLFNGPLPPRVSVRVDEIEKVMAGATNSTGDNTGVSQDALGVILREMEDNGWTGILAVGHPGGGKSLFAKALGNSHNIPTVSLDLGALKGSLVGQSEAAIRSAMKVIKGIAGRQAFFTATCNKLDSLPPELRRRFRLGIWFFDLPDETERKSIWAIHCKKFKIPTSDKPKDDGWTGAEIRNCVELAWMLGCSLKKAAEFVVPISTSDPEGIDKLRRAAAGRFLSAAYAGTYQQRAVASQSTNRRLINLGVAGEA